MSRIAGLFFLLASLACLGAWSGNASAAVTWQAAGTAVSGTTAAGIGATPPWPAHQVNDIALLFVESTGGQPVTLSVPNGFAVVPNSPQATGAGTAGTQLTVFWARATSAAMPAPRIATPSDHFYARIITFRGVINTGNPWDVTGGGVKAVASNSVSLTGVTTTVANTLVVQAVARDNDNAAAAFSAQANVNLTGIAERLDAGTTNGNGGGLGVWAGVKATAGATGNTTANVTNSINAFLTIALKPQAGAIFQAAGGGVGGTGAVSPAWPAHIAGDIALLFVESAGGEAATLSTPAGFVAVANSPQATGAGTAGTRITVFWARATSAAMPAPTVADPGNHVYARIITYRRVTNVGVPWNVTGGGVKTPASTSVSVTGVTTTVANTLIVQAVARDNDNAAAAFSAQANVNLTGITERSDAGTNQGNGGGFAVWDGAKATAGATGNTTATVTSSINAFLTIALAPAAAPAPVYQALGGAATTGLNWPTHAIDDIALLFIETTGGQIPTLADAAGFVQVANSPQATGGGTTGTRITVFWARATSALMAGPTITGPTDHIYARILTYRGAINTGNPWDVTGGGVKGGASTSVSVTGVTTTVANTLIVQAVARDNDNAAAAFGAQANINLTGIAERSDAGTTTGNGGGFVVWDGAKATAGATGNTTATVTNSRNAFLTIALKPPVAGPDHYELSLPAASVACLAGTATVTACADSASPCVNKYTAASGTTATLATTAGTLGLTTVTFDATGVATTTLSYPAAADGATATVTLSAEQTAATNPRKCCQGGVCVVANSCSTTFNTAGFIFSSSAGGAVATIPAQVAGTTSSTYYLRAVKTSTTTQACEAALTGASTVNFAYECNNPATCSASNLMNVNGGAATTIARNNNGSVVSYLPVSMTFDVNGNAPFTFNYSDVGQVKLWANKAAGGSLLTALAGSSNSFVVKPFGFVLSNIRQTAAPNLVNPAAANAAGAKFVKAGEDFSVTVTAVTATSTATPNYGKEAIAEGVTLTGALVAPVAGNNPALGNPAAFAAFSNGAATGTTFNWGEVGIITLTPSVADADYLGAGDITGTTSANVGRFFPDHLDTAVVATATTPTPCPTGLTCPALYNGFVYSGQAFSVQVFARNMAGGTTTNYDDPLGFSKAVTLTAWDALGSTVTQNPPGTSVLANNSVAATAFGAGVATTTIPTYTFATTPTAPTDIYLRAIDTDSASSLRAIPASSVEGGVKVVSGKAKLSNAHGSELLSLPMTATVQYYNGTNWLTSTTDSVTSLTFGLSNYQCKTGCAWTTTPTPLSAQVTSGILPFMLSKPTGGGTGSVDASITAPDYLLTASNGAAVNPSKAGRATFGVYKGANEFIYLRENY